MRRKNACLHVGICISTVNMARKPASSPPSKAFCRDFFTETRIARQVFTFAARINNTAYFHPYPSDFTGCAEAPYRV